MASEQGDKLSEALAELRASHAAQGRALTAIEQALQNTLEQGINALPQSNAPASEHRRKHRPGRPPKIEADPELQTFIVARLDRLTFAEIAAEVAENFLPSRQVGKTAIWEWWRKAKDHKSL